MIVCSIAKNIALEHIYLISWIIDAIIVRSERNYLEV